MQYHDHYRPLSLQIEQVAGLDVQALQAASDAQDHGQVSVFQDRACIDALVPLCILIVFHAGIALYV